MLAEAVAFAVVGEILDGDRGTTVNGRDALGHHDQTVEVVVVDLDRLDRIEQITDPRQLPVNGIVVGKVRQRHAVLRVGQAGQQTIRIRHSGKVVPRVVARALLWLSGFVRQAVKHLFLKFRKFYAPHFLRLWDRLLARRGIL